MKLALADHKACTLKSIMEKYFIYQRLGWVEINRSIRCELPTHINLARKIQGRRDLAAQNRFGSQTNVSLVKAFQGRNYSKYNTGWFFGSYRF